MVKKAKRIKQGLAARRDSLLRYVDRYFRVGRHAHNYRHMVCCP